MKIDIINLTKFLSDHNINFNLEDICFKLRCLGFEIKFITDINILELELTYNLKQQFNIDKDIYEEILWCYNKQFKPRYYCYQELKILKNEFDFLGLEYDIELLLNNALSYGLINKFIINNNYIEVLSKTIDVMEFKEEIFRINFYLFSSIFNNLDNILTKFDIKKLLYEFEEITTSPFSKNGIRIINPLKNNTTHINYCNYIKFLNFDMDCYEENNTNFQIVGNFGKVLNFLINIIQKLPNLVIQEKHILYNNEVLFFLVCNKKKIYVNIDKKIFQSLCENYKLVMTEPFIKQNIYTKQIEKKNFINIILLLQFIYTQKNINVVNICKFKNIIELLYKIQ